MSPEAFISLIIGGMLGFALGYGVRAGISSHRHARAMRRKMDLVTGPELQFTQQKTLVEQEEAVPQDNRPAALYKTPLPYPMDSMKSHSDRPSPSIVPKPSTAEHDFMSASEAPLKKF